MFGLKKVSPEEKALIEKERTREQLQQLKLSLTEKRQKINLELKEITLKLERL